MSSRRVYPDTPRSRGVLDAISHHAEGVWNVHHNKTAAEGPSEYRRAYAATKKRIDERQRRAIPQLTPAFRVGARVFVNPKDRMIHNPEAAGLPQKLRRRAEAGFVDAAGKFYARLEVSKEFGAVGESVSVAHVRERRALKDRISKDEGRKSSGEVEVSPYERDGHPVEGYTRRKPK